MGIEVGGLLGFIILVLDVWAIVSTLGSNVATGRKVLWILLILMLPVIGVVIWLIAGPRASRVAN